MPIHPILLMIIIYLIIMNCIAFALMGIDKDKARKGAWRIPEKSLFLSAILGGSIGAILGMQTFRHKTQHWYFKYGMPLIMILQIVAGGFLYLYLSGTLR